MPLLAIPFPMLDPVAFAVGPLVVRWYALAYIAGLLGGWWLATRLVRNTALWNGKPPLDAAGVDDMLVYAAAGVILGGRLGYVLFYNPTYYAQNPLEALMPWHGGMSFHGGLAGAGLALWLLSRRHAASVRSMFDLAAAVVPIGLFFGRIANFVNGELWGRVSDVPWAVVFPDAGPEPRHPSQLYQAGLEGLVLFVLMMALVRSGALRRPGLLAGAFLSGYGVVRIFGELFRQPDVQIGFLAGGLTMGMLLSVPLIVIGLTLALTAPRHQTS
ncbi:prolipoprotein diacylglyceryl transferase [Terrihabitans rhizophilus]|uniref:Phosphatidylglycerol--prolipoprotein diacylglyceryl transferase n=1 Tax=Terrihabitans rhizophilus TaxID=3092662 RepID=A0ABU4RU68_9HYPH|nr:prolipoprotein diacylglyceryl transferase [Terrihabitans sp. PJ23]MDX6806386.1 prolipoprotein diacylglyceryl transferase [Terrihabitans sp. PJ23]